MIQFLFGFLIVLFWILYGLHKKDIMSPSVILSLIYAFCVGFSFLNYELWDMENYSQQASMIIICSVLSFSFVGILYECVFYSGKSTMNTPFGQSTEIELVDKRSQVPEWFIYLNLMLCLVVDVWIFMANGGILSNREDININYPFILSLLVRYINIQGFFFACVFAKIVNFRSFRFKDLIVLFSIFSTCFVSIAQGTRITILKIMGCLGISIYLMWRKRRGWKKQIKFKTIALCSIVFVSFLFFFYFLKRYKIGDASAFTILEYLSMYISAPIKLLELFVEAPVDTSDIFGKETFVLLNYNLAELGLGEFYERHLEFRGLNNSIHLGNVYGAVRRYYSDFGLLGTIVLSGFFSYIFHKVYLKIKYSKKGKFDFTCVLYAYFFPCVLLFPIDDVFFSQLSIGLIFDLLLLYILHSLILTKRIRIKIR